MYMWMIKYSTYAIFFNDKVTKSQSLKLKSHYSKIQADTLLETFAKNKVNYTVL